MSASALLSTRSTLGYTVEVTKSEEGVCALRHYWQDLPMDPNGDIDFFLSVVRYNATVQSPYVITLKKGGALRVLLAGRIEIHPLQVHLGYKTLSSPRVRFLTLVHGGSLGEDSEDAARLLIEAVRTCLHDREAEVAWFHGLNPNSALYKVLQEPGGILSRDRYPVQSQRWRLRIPECYSELYRGRSANTRHNAKRYSKRLLDSFDGHLAVRSFRDPADVDALISQIESIASKTYHRGLGVGFVEDDQTRQLMKLAATRGWLRAYILYIAGRPCAFWNGFLYRRTFFTWTTGYDPEFNDFRPGLFLLQKMLESLCEERTADELDFGFGDAQYKRDWSDYKLLQTSQLVFGPGPRAVLINLARTPLIAATNATRSLLEHGGAMNRLRKIWRGHAAKKAA